MLIASGLAQHTTATTQMAHNHYDGGWWQSASTDERKGFLSGTDDCLTYDVHKPLRFFEVDWDNYETSISHFYATNPHQFGLPAFDVIGSKRNLKPRTRDFKTPENDHNGWRQAVPGARRGFIEGLTVMPHRIKARFSLEHADKRM